MRREHDRLGGGMGGSKRSARSPYDLNRLRVRGALERLAVPLGRALRRDLQLGGSLSRGLTHPRRVERRDDRIDQRRGPDRPRGDAFEIAAHAPTAWR
jgi:hypothetical protein